MALHVALLRGINVGGKNLIKMTDLRSCFERGGFRDVATFIASGNVIFRADRVAGPKLTRRIEEMLAAAFDYQASVVVRSDEQMREVVERAPRGFGAQPARYRYDVIFLKEPLSSAAAMESVLTREGVDEAHPGAGVLYFSRVAARAAQSLLPRLVGTAAYKQMTIRNWNTTTKLQRLLQGPGA
jgi:uncharacterized protein (DUF1697 family)